eukprot:TRINITY_DN75175_c0_g1_i1.p1 TRINITY_DN75175_c0_g1~~TRINITY_DN75175_c0_g1_i1.p1  ORF type:complete len:610 (+),score=46.79 TRINITY_DN75175_c0_g1_i1:110-1939(+)
MQQCKIIFRCNIISAYECTIWNISDKSSLVCSHQNIPSGYKRLRFAKNYLMNQLCEFCETNPATIKCLGCLKNNILCLDCYAFKHKNDLTKAHKSIPFTEVAKAQPITPGPICSYTCSDHGLNRRYICTTCEVTICSDCLVIGAHQFHKAIPFTTADEHTQQRFEETIKANQGVLERVAKMKATTSSKKEKLATSLLKSKTAIGDAFAKLREKIAKKETEVMATLENKYNNLLKLYKDVNTTLSDIDEKIRPAQAELSKALSLAKTQDGYDQLRNIKFPDIIAIKEVVDKTENSVAIIADEVPGFVLGFDLVQIGIDSFVTFDGTNEDEDKAKWVLKYLEEEKFAAEAMKKIQAELDAAQRQLQEKVKAEKADECNICGDILCKNCGLIECKICKKRACGKCNMECPRCKKKACANCIKEWKEGTCQECIENIRRKMPRKNKKYGKSNPYMEKDFFQSIKRIYSVFNRLGYSQRVCYFDLVSQKLINMNILVVERSGFIQVENRIYIVVGYPAIKGLKEFMESSQAIVPRTPTITPRSRIGLCKLINNTFCAIGVYNNDGYLRACEEYNIERNQFQILMNRDTVQVAFQLCKVNYTAWVGMEPQIHQKD